MNVQMMSKTSSVVKSATVLGAKNEGQGRICELLSPDYGAIRVLPARTRGRAPWGQGAARTLPSNDGPVKVGMGAAPREGGAP